MRSTGITASILRILLLAVVVLGAPARLSALERNCSDGIDNDGDGDVDCVDIDCCIDLACAGSPWCPPPESGDVQCSNGLDDDFDGYVDCTDPSCAGSSVCGETDCGNGLDDDGDGSTDCADSDCDTSPLCHELNCRNLIDDDGDTLVDCFDTDCFGDPACGEWSCFDGLDNDGDTLVDCLDVRDCCTDISCAGAPPCTTEWDCDDGIDNDGDGALDCGDADCAGDPLCGEQECSNGLDDDFDGDVDCGDTDCYDDPACRRAITVRGRVVHDPGTGPVPVPCCVVQVDIINHSSPPFTDSARATTRSDGTFTVTVDCSGDPSSLVEITVRPLCCGGTTVFSSTGCPASPFDVGDIGCVNVPIHDRSLLTGFVACRRGPFLEPVEGCHILIEPVGDPMGAQLTVTDPSGNWEACVPCGPGAPTSYRVTAQCCGLTELVAMGTGCPPIAVPAFTCTSCPVRLCPNREMVEVSGLLQCLDPGPDGIPGTSDDLILPRAGCDVRITTQGIDWDGDGVPDNCGPTGTTSTTTGADGRYVACVPSAVLPDCGNATWIVLVETCCGSSFTASVAGIPPALDLGPSTCRDLCPSGRPCGPSGTQVHGRVTCLDPAGGVVGVPGCLLTILCGRDYWPVTDANGYYSICIDDCSLCPSLDVNALCCGATTTVSLVGCPADVTADIRCTTCPPPPRPCPPDGAGNPQTEMTGLVLCRRPGLDTPMAGCPVHLRWFASSDPTNEVEADAITDGTGRYTLCMPCGPGAGSQLDIVEVTSGCCLGGSITTVPSCPDAATLTTVVCTDCTPCPPNSTRVQGKVICRGGGPVRGCVVVVTIDTCAGTRTFTTVTNSQGRYELCAPCPCPGGAIIVDATCCGSSRTLVPRRCGPTTPVPTLFCGMPCP